MTLPSWGCGSSKPWSTPYRQLWAVQCPAPSLWKPPHFYVSKFPSGGGAGGSALLLVMLGGGWVFQSSETLATPDGQPMWVQKDWAKEHSEKMWSAVSSDRPHSSHRASSRMCLWTRAARQWILFWVRSQAKNLTVLWQVLHGFDGDVVFEPIHFPTLLLNHRKDRLTQLGLFVTVAVAFQPILSVVTQTSIASGSCVGIYDCSPVVAVGLWPVTRAYKSRGRNGKCCCDMTPHVELHLHAMIPS